MPKQIIMLHRTGALITTGNITFGHGGQPFVYQRTDEVGVYEFDWSDYFTRDAETVTVTLASKNCTAAKTDGTDSASVTVSTPSKNALGYVRLTIAVTGGETFVMKLNVIGEAVE